MPERKPLVLGEPYDIKGDITSNAWVGARSARALEARLGFGPGRLAAGWWILVLKQPLTAADFTFSGITLRSGGRLGRPADDREADQRRTHVEAAMLAEYGRGGVDAMKAAALKRVSITGPDRLVKVVPVTGHSDAMAPSEQYPMGGGGLQWTLTRPCRFLVAVQVDANAVARTPGFSVFLGESASHDDRAKLARYIEGA